MTPQELANEVGRIVQRAQDRVGPGSIGAQQYHVDGQPQRFETMEFDALLEYAIEETLDFINYGVMLTIRLERMRAALQQKNRRPMTSPRRADELELLSAQKMDRPVPADPAMPTELSGQAAGDRGGAGTGAQHPEQAEAFVRWDVATLREQAAAIARLQSQVDSLQQRVADLERGESNEPV